MGYVLMIVILLGFGWYWNKGLMFKPFYQPAPKVEKTPRLMVNVFLGVVLLMVILQAFGVGRGSGFPVE